MREKMFSIGDDSWIETEGGERAFKVNGKALRIRDTLVVESPSGEELFTIQEKKLSVRDKMEIERDGRTVATVKKALVGLRDRYSIEVEGGDDLSAKGNVVDHEYEIERDGDKVAEVSKRWFRVRDAYGIEVAPGAGRRADPRRRDLHRPGWAATERCVRSALSGERVADAQSWRMSSAAPPPDAGGEVADDALGAHLQLREGDDDVACGCRRPAARTSPRCDG